MSVPVLSDHLDDAADLLASRLARGRLLEREELQAVLVLLRKSAEAAGEQERLLERALSAVHMQQLADYATRAPVLACGGNIVAFPRAVARNPWNGSAA